MFACLLDIFLSGHMGVYMCVCPLSAGMTVHAAASAFYGNTKNTNLGAPVCTVNTV